MSNGKIWIKTLNLLQIIVMLLLSLNSFILLRIVICRRCRFYCEDYVL